MFLVLRQVTLRVVEGVVSVGLQVSILGGWTGLYGLKKTGIVEAQWGAVLLPRVYTAEWCLRWLEPVVPC